jgi:outer membrane protein OmpA-like peptidoglycan-associated protein
MRGFIGVMLLCFGVSCATVAPPKDLVEARSRYDAALHSDQAKQDPRGLWGAKLSLDRANLAFDEAPGTPRAATAAREALTDIHRWEFLRQVARLDKAMQRFEATEPPGGLELSMGHFTRPTDSEQRIGALGAAVRGMGELKQDASGVTLRFASGALFERGQRELKLPARERLERAADAMQRYAPDARVRVVASIDYPFDSETNQTLAADRARAVRDELVDSGVPPQNITSSSHHLGGRYGEEQKVEIHIQPLHPPAAQP